MSANNKSPAVKCKNKAGNKLISEGVEEWRQNNWLMEKMLEDY